MLIVIGDLVEDVVVWLAEPLRTGTDTRAEIFHVRGGSAANVANFAAADWPTRFIGCVGSDRLGDSLVQELTDVGIDVCVERAGRTGSVVVLIDADGERTMVPDRGAASLLSRIPVNWLDEADLIHVTSYSFATDPTAGTVLETLRAARAQGVPICIDASSTGMIDTFGRERYLDLLEELAPALLLANHSEAEYLDLYDLKVRQARFPVTMVVCKAGAEPTTVFKPGRADLRVPVPPVELVRDATGAGDAFAAGFLTGYLRSGDLQRACEHGHALAARILQNPGAHLSTKPASSGSGA